MMSCSRDLGGGPKAGMGGGGKRAGGAPHP